MSLQRDLTHIQGGASASGQSTDDAADSQKARQSSRPSTGPSPAELPVAAKSRVDMPPQQKKTLLVDAGPQVIQIKKLFSQHKQLSILMLKKQEDMKKGVAEIDSEKQKKIEKWLVETDLKRGMQIVELCCSAEASGTQKIFDSDFHRFALCGIITEALTNIIYCIDFRHEIDAEIDKYQGMLKKFADTKSRLDPSHINEEDSQAEALDRLDDFFGKQLTSISAYSERNCKVNIYMEYMLSSLEEIKNHPGGGDLTFNRAVIEHSNMERVKSAFPFALDSNIIKTKTALLMQRFKRVDQFIRLMHLSLMRGHRDDVNKLFGESFRDHIWDLFKSAQLFADKEVAELVTNINIQTLPQTSQTSQTSQKAQEAPAALPKEIFSVYNLGPKALSTAETVIGQIDFLRKTINEKLDEVESSEETVPEKTSKWIKSFVVELACLRSLAVELKELVLQRKAKKNPVVTRSVASLRADFEELMNVGQINKTTQKPSKKPSKSSASTQPRRRQGGGGKSQKTQPSGPISAASTGRSLTEHHWSRWKSSGKNLLKSYENDFKQDLEDCKKCLDLEPSTSLTEYRVDAMSIRWRRIATQMKNIALQLQNAIKEGTHRLLSNEQDLLPNLFKAVEIIEEHVKVQVEHLESIPYQFPQASDWGELLEKGQIRKVSEPKVLRSEPPNTLFEYRIEPHSDLPYSPIVLHVHTKSSIQDSRQLIAMDSDKFSAMHLKAESQKNLGAEYEQDQGGKVHRSAVSLEFMRKLLRTVYPQEPGLIQSRSN